jgi:hypothetical protein
MGKLVLLGIVILSFVGCTHSGSSNGGGIAPGNTPPSATPSGFYQSTGSDEVLYNQSAQCPSSNYRLDARLKVGQEYVLEDSWTDQDGGYSGNSPNRVVFNSIDTTKGVLVKTMYLSGPGGRSAWVRETCKYSTFNNLDMKCEFTDSSVGVSRPKSNERVIVQKACDLKWDGSQQSGIKHDTGTYKFADGRVVTAVRTIEHSSGMINCNVKDGDQWKDVGSGTLDRITVQSLDVPEPETLSCGSGTTIFEYVVVKDQSGATVSVRKREIHAAKY